VTNGISGALLPATCHKKSYNLEIQLSEDSVIPRTQQRLRTSNFHYHFPRLKETGFTANENKAMVHGHQRVAALQTIKAQQYTSDRADQLVYRGSYLDNGISDTAVSSNTCY
jgi:hypothetical protein